MLRNLRSRRRPRYGVFLCAVVSGLLLLLLVSLLRSGIIWHSPPHEFNYDSLLSDSATNDATAGNDIIDAIDVVDEKLKPEQDTADADDDDEPLDEDNSSGFFFHHVEGVIRRSFSKGSMDEEGTFMGSEVVVEDRGRTAFGSDDVAVEERVRLKAIEVKGVEDALLLKVGKRVSPLREGWGDWFDKKSDFLRKDKVFRSNLEILNPLHNPIIQDPDALSLTGITKVDKIIRNSILNEFKRVPFPSRKIIQDHPNL
ncbi:hypothetical protein RJT34_31695 [Clitoria ternatea]|uniref:Uncharacterized protein n=1 Tax=Clitoria ternatea TaxID=43366 RepID=A0AAN9EUP3_CLITE